MNDTITNGLDRILAIIDQAKQHEQETEQLLDFLEREAFKLHASIQLPEKNTTESLHRFIVDYVTHVPSFIRAIHEMAENAHIEESAKPILSMAITFFLDPPQLLQVHTGMTALMDEAYLAHRLLEEINDRFINMCGQPLAPMDMTRSNLIVHHLIGEPFANELDSAVQYSVELIMARREEIETEAFDHYINEHKERGWSQEITQWPCLAEDLAIELNFSLTAQPSSNMTH